MSKKGGLAAAAAALLAAVDGLLEDGKNDTSNCVLRVKVMPTIDVFLEKETMMEQILSSCVP